MRLSLNAPIPLLAHADLSRIIPIMLTTVGVERLARAFLRHPDRILVLMSLAAEGTALVLLLAARPARDEQISIRATFLSFASSYFFIVVGLCHNEALVRPAVAVALMASGTGLQIYSKIALGRSFGVLPANRGVVVHGPYAVVRHPIYLSYLITHLGFLLGNFSLWNLAMLAIVHFLLALRAIEEEGVLRASVEYQEFMTRTRWRIVPKVF
jgi:protein-S-isoprenylcysteine O-methyltransferase Ste14